MSINEKKLTSQNYWESYYKESNTERKHITRLCSVYDSFWQDLFGSNAENKTLVEIGGYPGRYLAYLSYKYKLNSTCFDYNSDTRIIKNSFKSFGVKDYELIQDDFTSCKVEKQYDYVMSNGFIEHFKDFNSIMDRHVGFLKPGGRLLIMIPNKRYLRKIYGLLCDSENLKVHNLKCMSKKVFRKFAERNDLKVERLEYFGGFPFSVHQKLNTPQRIIYKLTRQIFKFHVNPYLEKYPSKYLSSSLIGIFEKPHIQKSEVVPFL